MTKSDIHKRFIEQLTRQLHGITEATQHAISDVTNPEHKARSKYDTFSLETSYLARGQALRVEMLRESLAKLRAMPLKPFTYEDPIRVGALVVVMDAEGEEACYLMTHAEGGAEIETGEGTVSLITPASPMGKVMLGKKAGERFEFPPGPRMQPFSILVVE